VPRQVNPERRADAECAGHGDEAVVLHDDTLDRRQPETRALSHVPRREERLEHLRQCLAVHPAAVVAHREAHVLAGDTFWVDGAVDRVDGGVSRLDGQVTGVRDRVPGIEAGVGQHLADLGRVRLDRPQIRRRLPGDLDVLADQPPESFSLFLPVAGLR
jgi:hypothetical protein